MYEQRVKQNGTARVVLVLLFYNVLRWLRVYLFTWQRLPLCMGIANQCQCLRMPFCLYIYIYNYIRASHYVGRSFDRKLRERISHLLFCFTLFVLLYIYTHIYIYSGNQLINWAIRQSINQKTLLYFVSHSTDANCVHTRPLLCVYVISTKRHLKRVFSVGFTGWLRSAHTRG